MSYSLFKRYPVLIETLSRIPLGEFPTPVEKLSGLCRRYDRDNLFIKRDDLSSPIYGGNKVRKLEFLLADALKQGKDFWFVMNHICAKSGAWFDSPVQPWIYWNLRIPATLQISSVMRPAGDGADSFCI